MPAFQVHSLVSPDYRLRGEIPENEFPSAFPHLPHLIRMRQEIRNNLRDGLAVAKRNEAAPFLDPDRLRGEPDRGHDHGARQGHGLDEGLTK